MWHGLTRTPTFTVMLPIIVNISDHYATRPYTHTYCALPHPPHTVPLFRAAQSWRKTSTLTRPSFCRPPGTNSTGQKHSRAARTEMNPARSCSCTGPCSTSRLHCASGGVAPVNTTSLVARPSTKPGHWTAAESPTGGGSLLTLTVQGNPSIETTPHQFRDHPT